MTQVDKDGPMTPERKIPALREQLRILSEENVELKRKLAEMPTVAKAAAKRMRKAEQAAKKIMQDHDDKKKKKEPKPNKAKKGGLG
jgi:hypothetical protein